MPARLIAIFEDTMPVWKTWLAATISGIITNLALPDLFQITASSFVIMYTLWRWNRDRKRNNNKKSKE